ncbi:MAG: YbhB/YbcL family Raf kinase inhibitor-like protein [bacterium]
MPFHRSTLGLLLLVGVLGSQALAQNPPAGAPPAGRGGGGRGRAVQVMTLTSSAWKDGDVIPVKYSQPGEEVSPPLSWSGAPDSAVSFVLIAHDANAAIGNGLDDMLQWMVWNIPGSARSLPEAVPQGGQLPDGARQISATGPYYRGPAAPSPGPAHHYLFELYALDAMLDVPAVGAAPPATRAAIMAAMGGHVRAKAVMVGTFVRRAP